MAEAVPDAYPRTYRLALWLRMLVIGVGVLFGAPLAVALVWLAARGASAGTLEPVALGALLLGAFGAWMIASALRTQVLLTQDGISVRWAIRTRQMNTADIAGRRLLRIQYGQKITALYAKDAQRRELKIPTGVRADAAWDAWLQALPDLDAQQVRELEAEVAANPELGQTPEERLRRLAAARKLARTLNGVSYGAMLWVFLYPRPYELALLAAAALPWLAIVLAAKSHGLYRLDTQRNDARPTLGSAVLLPGLALLTRALTDVGVLDIGRALTLAAAVAVLLSWAALVSSGGWGGRRVMALLLLGFSCAYGYGSVVLANREFDRAPGEGYRVAVLGRHMNRGSRSTTYHLLLDHWGPRSLPNDVAVPRQLYEQAAPGTLVCVHRGPGALSISWFQVSLCLS
ncbi:MAG: hypothetical protein ACLPTM_04820 [Steroidobacteraceae bacterium]